ncbi:hypothetical protein ABEF89_00545 [Acinetobacter thermotolerans]|uniref:hypothetical protein n=1 Tax=Acinetobacter thermotolerans TaxID=3151487 RepID=UPI00325BAB63
MVKTTNSNFLSKDDLFESLFYSAFTSSNIMEHYLESEGLTAKAFGLDVENKHKEAIFGFHEPRLSDFPGELLEDAKAHYRESVIWRMFDNVYDYAINGIKPIWDWMEVFEELPIYLQLMNTDYSRVNPDIYKLLGLAYLRFGMDELIDSCITYFDYMPCDPIEIIALMAKLDQRTVKNAQSEGAFKGESEDFDFQAIKRWLSTKKGFVKPQWVLTTDKIDLKEVNSSKQFGELISKRIEYLGNLFNPKVFISKHYSFDKNTVLKLQQGIFDLPLSAATIIANQLSLDEREFLNCVMRIFFPYELSIIQGGSNG